MPSGTTPLNVFEVPEEYGYDDLSIKVDIDVVEHLRSTLEETREEAYRFVDDEFKAAAEEVYAELGMPPLTLEQGWQIFAAMRGPLHRMYDDSM